MLKPLTARWRRGRFQGSVVAIRLLPIRGTKTSCPALSGSDWAPVHAPVRFNQPSELYVSIDAGLGGRAILRGASWHSLLLSSIRYLPFRSGQYSTRDRLSGGSDEGEPCRKQSRGASGAARFVILNIVKSPLDVAQDHLEPEEILASSLGLALWRLPQAGRNSESRGFRLA